MKRIVSIVLFLTGMSVFAALPKVTSVSYSQDAHRVVKIVYTLDAAAIITADVLIDGVSVGAAALTNMTGDVNCLVTKSSGEILWNIRAALPGHQDITTDSVRIALTAWPKDNPPDYLVADLSSENADVTRYYTGSDAIPGGLMANPVYRESKLVLKRVHVSGCPYICGADGTESKLTDGGSYVTSVTFPNDYYLAVFEFTQQQRHVLKGETGTKGWAFIQGDHPGWKPQTYLDYYSIRESADGSRNDEYAYPNPPHSDSWLGLLRTRCGLALDLPTETQWELAARAGLPTGYWGNGKLYTRNAQVDENFDACYYGTGGRDTGAEECGKFGFNNWGFADLGGNAAEYVLDSYVDNPTTASGFGSGMPYVDVENVSCVVKGGSFNDFAYVCHPQCRLSLPKSNSSTYYYGFRVAAPLSAGL